jgi:hypothetical protein
MSMNAETHPKRRVGKYVILNEGELEVLDELARREDRSASAVVRVALRLYALQQGVIKE